ncbi:sensor histidine kinase [Sphingomonas azotifigens]|uniref:sensor histidine kinase n=1 Tax=Sphingomonas azotifigens TaxID=330920 RepID=UPI0009FF4C51|nr:HAMP domain-containing sensor histidine kinase [Sphingomonas azotifigens]
MGSEWRNPAAAFGSGMVLALGGACFVLAWQAHLWASFVGAGIVLCWVIGLGCWTAARRPLATAPRRRQEDALPLRLLLDQVPVPLVRAEGTRAQALNRAARTLFVTNDRIPPVVALHLASASTHLRHDGRSFRLDAVEGANGHRLVALIDAEAEQRAAEERASDEMIDILGHELLNGLSPIVSLADSAITAASAGDAALPAILATLARRVEGLEAFTRAYRDLARLPAPVREPVVLEELADDLTRLFAARFAPNVTLTVEGDDGAVARIDRDQMTQAIWALLQNGAEAALAASAPCAVGLRFELSSSGALTISVTDSGDGMPLDERAAIFRPFHTTKPGGSGIGLSLARRIARAHGGDVTLRPDLTTTFRLEVGNTASV